MLSAGALSAATVKTFLAAAAVVVAILGPCGGSALAASLPASTPAAESAAVTHPVVASIAAPASAVPASSPAPARHLCSGETTTITERSTVAGPAPAVADDASAAAVRPHAPAALVPTTDPPADPPSIHRLCVIRV